MINKFLHYKTLVLAPTLLAVLAAGGCTKEVKKALESINIAGSASISGTPEVGQSFTSSVVDINGTSGSAFVYQWLRSGANISGATSSGYTAVDADVGSRLSLNVKYTDEAGFAENVTSAASAVVLAVNSAGSVTVAGTAEVGETLTATVTDGNGLSGSTITYQWQSGTTDIDGATSQTFEITDDQGGKTIRVIAKYTDEDGFSETVTSGNTDTVPAPAVGANFKRGTLGANDSVPEVDCDTVYMSASALADAVEIEAGEDELAAGTTLCLADGTYDGLELKFTGVGTEALPITVAAENPGKAIINGEVGVNMSGEYLVLQGLVFKDGEVASSDFLQTRTSDTTFCNNCRITEIAVIDVASEDSGKWLNIYGQDNRIDHSWFAGKSNTGALLIVNREIRDGEAASDVKENRTQIDHNYFGDRPPTNSQAYATNDDNDYEAIRIGTSDAHAFDSKSVVEYNYFERIDGEAEVISNKSGHNTIANNTIRDSHGSLTTRHGEAATIDGNFIMGDGHPYAGGLRIIDSDHRIVNNYIEGARYQSTRFHGGIVIHNSDGSDSNGYQDVSNVLIAHNTVVDSVNSLNVNGGNQSDNPEDIIFANNIIAGAIGPIITYAEEGMPSGTYAGNYVEGTPFSDDAGLTSFGGFTVQDSGLDADALGVSRPTANNAAAVAADAAVNLGGFDPINDDMDGDVRAAATQSGSDHISDADAARGLLADGDVGPISYRPAFSKGYITRVALGNSGFDSGADDWTFGAPSSVTTDAEEVFSRGASAKIEGAGRVSQSAVVTPNTNYTLTAFTKGPIKFGADVGGTEATTDANNSDYRLSTSTFSSGDATSVTVFAELDDDVSASVDIKDPTFTDFNGKSSDPNWPTDEGGTLGQVQTTGNSASGANGAIKFKLDKVGELGGQSVSQVLTNIQPNTDYTITAYCLYKKDDDFGVSATIGLYAGETDVVVGSKVCDYAALEAAGAEEADDNFLKDSFVVNSGDNATLTLFIKYTTAHSLVVIDGDANGARSNSEFWVDDISMSFEGAPAADAEVFFDDMRLVAHGATAD